MRSKYSTICLISLVVVSVTAQADDKAVRKALASDYAGIGRAFKKNDLAAMTAFMTPDFKAIRPNGQTIDRAQVAADFKQQRAALTSVDWQRKIEKLTVKDTEAIVTVHGKLIGTSSDPQGKHHTLLLITTSRDTWTKTGTAWKIKASEVTEFHIIVDGKPLGQGAPGK